MMIAEEILTIRVCEQTKDDFFWIRGLIAKKIIGKLTGDTYIQHLLDLAKREIMNDHVTNLDKKEEIVFEKYEAQQKGI